VIWCGGMLPVRFRSHGPPHPHTDPGEVSTKEMDVEMSPEALEDFPLWKAV
jgi:hypothetical protein